MVVMRYILNESTVWQTEFTTYSIVGATLIGSPYVLLRRGHVNVDLLPLYLPHRARLALAAMDRLCTDPSRHLYPLPPVHRRHPLPGNGPRHALWPAAGRPAMNPLEIGAVIGVVTIIVLASGIPIAFGLGAVAIVFLVMFDGWGSLDIVADTFFSGLAEFALVSIPMFVLMGAAVASSPAGKDL